MKKVLALIVEYKLNNRDLSTVVERIGTLLDDQHNENYPNWFKTEMRLAFNELQYEVAQNKNNHQTILDILGEMEGLIVDYLTGVHMESNLHCFF